MNFVEKESDWKKLTRKIVLEFFITNRGNYKIFKERKVQLYNILRKFFLGTSVSSRLDRIQIYVVLLVKEVSTQRANSLVGPWSFARMNIRWSSRRREIFWQVVDRQNLSVLNFRVRATQVADPQQERDAAANFWWRFWIFDDLRSVRSKLQDRHWRGLRLLSSRFYSLQRAIKSKILKSFLFIENYKLTSGRLTNEIGLPRGLTSFVSRPEVVNF